MLMVTQLSVVNLQAANGKLRDNNDGTWTFTPDSNFNGEVSPMESVMGKIHFMASHRQRKALIYGSAVNDAPVVFKRTD